MMTLYTSWKTWAKGLTLAATLYSGGLCMAMASVGEPLYPQLDQSTFAAHPTEESAAVRVQTDIDEGDRLSIAEMDSTAESSSVSIPSVEIRAARPTLPATANMKMRIARLVKPIIVTIGGFLLPLAFVRVG